MKLENETTSNLINKNKQKAKEAAQKIINNPDIEAWKCLIENTDYLFSYIKDKAGRLLVNEIKQENINKVFELLKFHDGDWDEYIAEGLSKYADAELNERMLNLLKEGSMEEKIYAAGYFCRIQYPCASESLFQASNEYAQRLKSNTAEALGMLQDEVSYRHYLEKLNSEDEWDRIEAAQFLAKYGNRDAAVQILQAMENSAMAELIAGEIATLIDIYELFSEEDEKTRELALEAMDNILSGIPEVWPLGVILDFKIFECIDKLLNLAKGSRVNNLSGRYAQILLKAKQKIIMFSGNSQYTYDEEKDILAELDEIHHLLVYEDDEFWNIQQQRLLKELESDDKKRKLAAISVINEMELHESVPFLLKIALKQDEDEVVICESITTLAKMGHTEKIDKDILLSRIKDPNLLAIVNNSLIQGVN